MAEQFDLKRLNKCARCKSMVNLRLCHSPLQRFEDKRSKQKCHILAAEDFEARSGGGIFIKRVKKVPKIALIAVAIVRGAVNCMATPTSTASIPTKCMHQIPVPPNDTAARNTQNMARPARRVPVV